MERGITRQPPEKTFWSISSCPMQLGEREMAGDEESITVLANLQKAS